MTNTIFMLSHSGEQIELFWFKKDALKRVEEILDYHSKSLEACKFEKIEETSWCCIDCDEICSIEKMKVN